VVHEVLEFDVVVKVLENPVRREILKRLAEEPQYILQLSKQMSVSQQAVTKHMRVLEEAKMVHSVDVRHGQGGAPRKYYYLKDFYSVHLEVGPGLYRQDTEVKSGDSVHDLQKEEDMVGDAVLQDNVDRLNEILTLDDRASMASGLFEFINAIDERTEGLESVRKILMKLRALAQSELHKQIVVLSEDYRHRQVLYRMVDEVLPYKVNDPYEIAEILSEDLDMRIKEVEFVFEELWDNSVFRRLIDPHRRLK